jgi:hypothetical protein
MRPVQQQYPCFFYAAFSSSTLPVDLLNALHCQEFFVGGLSSYAVALINIGWFRARLYRKHARDIARLALMVEVERLSGDRYPLAAHHARIEQSLLRKELGNRRAPWYGRLDPERRAMMAAVDFCRNAPRATNRLIM